MRAIKRFFKKLRRSFQYAVFSWDNEDWDFAFMWALLEFKLKRVKIELDNGFGVQKPEDQAALVEAISICGQLSKDYNFAAIEDAAHEEKWGELKMEFIKIPNSTHSTAKFSYSKALTDEMYKDASAESSANFNLAYEREMLAIKRFGEILHDHSRSWWD
jgi:hypothetical protein